MKLILLWLIIGSVAVISGVALLTNVLEVTAQQMGVLENLCTVISDCMPELCFNNIDDDGDGLIDEADCKLPVLHQGSSSLESSSEELEINANPWGLNTDEPTLELLDDSVVPPIDDNLVVLEEPPTSLDDANLKNGNQGCSVSFWVENEQGSADGLLVWPAGYLPQDKFSSTAYFNTQITISSMDDPSFIDALNSQNDGIDKLARQSVAALLNAAHPEISYPLTIAEVLSMTNNAIMHSDYSVADTFATYNNLGNSGLCP